MRFVFILVVSLSLALSGCFQSMHVKCKGKGKMTVVGGPYGGTIEGDCGDGFMYERDSEKFDKTPVTEIAPVK